MTARLGISITATGPVFGSQGGVVATPSVFALDGAHREFERVVADSVTELAKLGTARLFQQGQSRPSGVFLSVEEANARHSTPSTGYWRAHLISTIGHLHATIENPVVYNNWLEGVSSRNEQTRFKGYGLWRATQSYLEAEAPKVADRIAARAVERLNG